MLQYFELHRGTYTTQVISRINEGIIMFLLFLHFVPKAKNKLHNRKCEFLLHDIEFLASIAQAIKTASGQGTAPLTQ